MMWKYLEEKRTPTSANIMVVDLFGLLLYCEKMKVNGRPRSFGPAQFSLTMTLNTIFKLTVNISRTNADIYKYSRKLRFCSFIHGTLCNTP